MMFSSRPSGAAVGLDLSHTFRSVKLAQPVGGPIAVQQLSASAHDAAAQQRSESERRRLPTPLAVDAKTARITATTMIRIDPVIPFGISSTVLYRRTPAPLSLGLPRSNTATPARPVRHTTWVAGLHSYHRAGRYGQPSAMAVRRGSHTSPHARHARRRRVNPLATQECRGSTQVHDTCSLGEAQKEKL